MTDIFGNIIDVGDIVYFVESTNYGFRRNASIHRGSVVKVYTYYVDIETLHPGNTLKTIYKKKFDKIGLFKKKGEINEL